MKQELIEEVQEMNQEPKNSLVFKSKLNNRDHFEDWFKGQIQLLREIVQHGNTEADFFKASWIVEDIEHHFKVMQVSIKPKRIFTWYQSFLKACPELPGRKRERGIFWSNALCRAYGVDVPEEEVSKP